MNYGIQGWIKKLYTLGLILLFANILGLSFFRYSTTHTIYLFYLFLDMNSDLMTEKQPTELVICT